MRQLYGLLFLAATLSTLPLMGQDDGPVLPRGLSPEEKALLPFYVPPQVSHLLSPLPALRDGQPFRTMAEWEELQAVVITWTSFQAVLAQIVKALQKECRVIIVCTNENTVKNYLTGQGVDWSQNVTFLQGAYNSIWVRDFGPNTVYLNGVDSLYLVDWIYNRPRPLDDQVPFLVGSHLGLPVLSTALAPDDLVHTGGNFMSDGLGTGFSSNLVLDENGPGNKFGTSNHDVAAVDGIMDKFMGIGPYIKMTNLPFDGIHHIDMHMKLLDEETLLVGQYPEGIADGPQIEANLQYVLSQFHSPFGTPYKVIRMPMPPDGTGKYPHQGGHYRTYTNSLVANRTIIVPTYHPQYDSTALRIYREAKPGYDVVGINCNAIIPSGGALHCITKEIGTHDPLLMVHQPVRGDEVSGTGIPVRALIRHREGIDQAWLYWTADTLLGYTALPMSPSGEADHWEAEIPFTVEGGPVFYYLEAVAGNGKQQRRPMTAPHGYWHFTMPEGPTSRQEPMAARVQILPAFPNPASAITCLPVDLGDYHGPLEISLTDVWGRTLPLFQGQVSGGERKFFLNASEYPSGVWQLRYRTAQEQFSQTLLIRNP
jgi:agmatine deiminase